jgi:hypothetical protein
MGAYYSAQALDLPIALLGSILCGNHFWRTSRARPSKARKSTMKRALSWGLYFGFVAAAFGLNWSAAPLDFSGPAGGVKSGVLVVWLGFLAFSIQCSAHEDLFSSFGAILKRWWGRQVVADLYISMALSALVIYAVTGSWLIAALWAAPLALFANLAVLPFVLIYFEQIAGLFG